MQIRIRCPSDQFASIISGNVKAVLQDEKEIRHKFKIGEVLTLREWVRAPVENMGAVALKAWREYPSDPKARHMAMNQFMRDREEKMYTGREYEVQITGITHDTQEYLLHSGVVMLSINSLQTHPD